MFDANFLFASLIWGAIGSGYFIYGKRQRDPAMLLGGVLLIGASYLVESALWMSLLCIALLILIHRWPRS